MAGYQLMTNENLGIRYAHRQVHADRVLRGSSARKTSLFAYLPLTTRGSATRTLFRTSSAPTANTGAVADPFKADAFRHGLGFGGASVCRRRALTARLPSLCVSGL
jgi:hypothetical protein